MAKVKIEGNASGTGTFTIAAPNSNTDRTLTLPDEAGTVLTSASDLSGATGMYADSDALSLFNASGSAPVYACRAWVNFNGTGTVAIRASGNVSSITDENTGSYLVNFTTAMPDANYASIATAQGVVGSQFASGFSSEPDSSSRAYVFVVNDPGTNTRVDVGVISYAAFR